jgi:hypothetical protein
MSQQSEIFARYRSLFNSKSFRPLENETSRRLNNMDFVDFLFELVKATKGQKQFKNIILKGSLSKLKKVDELNKVITKSLFNQFGCDNTIVIPTKYTTKGSLGIEINKNEIDAFGLLGIDPNTKPGNYMYEGDNPTQHVNFLLYKAQGILKENAALSISHKNNELFTIYSKNPNTFIFKFGAFYENKKFNVWLNDYLALTNPVFNMVNFTTILTDLITGAISIKTNKSKLEIRKQNSTILGLQKLFGFCSEAPVDGGASENSANDILKKELDANFNGDTSIGQPIGIGNINNNQNVNPNPFDFNFNDLDEIERNTYLRSNNQIRFSTCGNLDLDINPDDIIAGLDELFNNSNINNVYSYDGISNNQTQLNDTTVTTTNGYDNSQITPNVTKSADFFDNALKNGAQKAIDLGETNVIIDLPNMNAELQLNILKAIPYALMQMVLTPKIVMVPKLFAVLIDDNTTKTTNDLLNSMTGSIQTIGTTVTNLLIQNIFDAIKSDLTNLAKELAIAFLRQRGIDYLSTLKSLLGILGLFGGSSGGCGGVLDKLLRLLKLSNFGPMPMLPPPLILVAGGIKPGMNSVAMINDIKASLTEKGIETAPTLPDGTPNNMMIAIEETVKTMVSHIKTNSTIQTFGIGAMGPVSGYGQIQ